MALIKNIILPEYDLIHTYNENHFIVKSSFGKTRSKTNL
jgi:hypothetical protein